MLDRVVGMPAEHGQRQWDAAAPDKRDAYRHAESGTAAAAAAVRARQRGPAGSGSHSGCACEAEERTHAPNALEFVHHSSSCSQGGVLGFIYILNAEPAACRMLQENNIMASASRTSTWRHHSQLRMHARMWTPSVRRSARTTSTSSSAGCFSCAMLPNVRPPETPASTGSRALLPSSCGATP